MKLLLISHLNTNRWPLQKRDKVLFLILFMETSWHAKFWSTVFRSRQ
jgi:hypothetical protein